MTDPASPPMTLPRGQAASPLKIVISGYYGYNNLGDEAILTAMVQQIRTLEPEAELTALSGNPSLTAQSQKISALHRMAMPQILSALRGADLFISGGGSLLQDVTGPASVPYYLGLVKLAQWLGTPTMLFGQGIGPLDRAHNRWLVGHVARGVDRLTVRDQASRELLALCGVPIDQITLTVDPVLALAPVSDARAEQLWRGLGLEVGRPTIAVSIRPWKTWYERQLKAFSSVLVQRAESWGAQILLLPFHRPDDDALIDELQYCLETRPASHRPPVRILSWEMTPAEMMGMVGRVDLLVGMRLHALIMGAAMGVPSIGVVYDPKVATFSERVGFPTIASVTALEEITEVAALLTHTWERRHVIRANLAAQRPAWRADAMLNVEMAVELARRSHARLA